MTKYFDIESPACDAVCASSILLDLISDHFGSNPMNETGSSYLIRLTRQEADNLLFAAGQVSQLTLKTKAAFYAAHEQGEKGSQND